MSVRPRQASSVGMMEMGMVFFSIVGIAESGGDGVGTGTDVGGSHLKVSADFDAGDRGQVMWTDFGGCHLDVSADSETGDLGRELETAVFAVEQFASAVVLEPVTLTGAAWVCFQSVSVWVAFVFGVTLVSSSVSIGPDCLYCSHPHDRPFLPHRPRTQRQS